MRRVRFQIAAFVSVFMAGCVGAEFGSADQEIINGDAVGGEELPTVGGVSTNAGSVCTGTLISPTVVLTAAHCVEPNILKQSMPNPPDEIVYFFTFAHDVHAASDAELLEVASVKWHEQFLMDTSGLLERPGKWHDIAVMHLAEPVDRPVQELAPTDVVEALEMGRDYLVAGYGLTQNGNPASAGSLMKGMSGLDERGDYELIAGIEDNQQACRGDSGGPIFADDGDTYQIGIASRINAELFPPPSSPPPCETGLLYTRVDAYSDWIEEQVSGGPDGDGDGDGTGDGNGDGTGDGDGTGGGESDTGGGCAVASGSSNGALGGLLFLLAGALGLPGALRRRRE